MALNLMYFSAHWCPPCRGFTPNLAKFYCAANKGQKEANEFDASLKAAAEEQAKMNAERCVKFEEWANANPVREINFPI